MKTKNVGGSSAGGLASSRDPDNFVAIIQELNKALDDKELRLNKGQNLSSADR
jgi:GH18 family chitinase